MYDHTTQVLAAIACGLFIIFASTASAESNSPTLNLLVDQAPVLATIVSIGADA